MTESSTEYDKQFQELQALNLLKWKPWVGKNYKKCTGNKLLIVGESHYDEKKENIEIDQSSDNGLTRIMIHSDGIYGLGKPTDGTKKSLHRFLRNTERALFNKKSLTKAECETLWHSVCFYNFIQRPMFSKKDRPEQTDWEVGNDTFFKLINILQPNYVLFCGFSVFKQDFLKRSKEQGDYMCEIGVNKRKEKIGAFFIRTKGIISRDGSTITISSIRHPSQSFAWSEWHKIVNSHMPEYISWLKGNKLISL